MLLLNHEHGVSTDDDQVNFSLPALFDIRNAD
jgi:hypothetical protein